MIIEVLLHLLLLLIVLAILLEIIREVKEVLFIWVVILLEEVLFCLNWLLSQIHSLFNELFVFIFDWETHLLKFVKYSFLFLREIVSFYLLLII
jgi:hypothetical protein